jgi:hypothetical protein
MDVLVMREDQRIVALILELAIIGACVGGVVFLLAKLYGAG